LADRHEWPEGNSPDQVVTVYKNSYGPQAGKSSCARPKSLLLFSLSSTTKSTS